MYFENAENSAKLPIGPTFAKPGPTLLKQVATAVNVVSKSKPLKLTNNKIIAIPYLMGCHRGGGDWNAVYKMIEEIFANSNCEVLICEYNGG